MKASATGEWMDHAICTYKDPTLWDGVPVNRSRTAGLDFSAAKKICAACPVSNICLSHAVEIEETGCMRGGKTPGELKALVKERRIMKVSGVHATRREVAAA